MSASKPADWELAAARAANLLDIIPDAAISIDHSQRILLFNHAAQEMFGYTSAEALGQPLELFLPALAAQLRGQGAESAAAPAGPWQATRGLRKDGSQFPGEASKSELVLQGETTYNIVLRNISERVASEEKLRERQKTEEELRIAHNIQASFLPRELPDPPGWEIAASFQPAREVAGDFYDAFTLSQGRRVGFVVADVVDKGVPAALFMALIRSLTRAFAQQHYTLSWTDVLADDAPALRPTRRSGRGRALPTTGTTSLRNAVLLTNNYVLENHADLNYFATLFFGMLDPASGQLSYINAGHNPPFIVGADGAIKAKLTATGPAVGMLPGVDFAIESAQLDPGDILYSYTDGVTEARDLSRTFYGEARLVELLSQPATSAVGLLERVRADLDRFMASAPQADDITMMAVCRQGQEPGT